MKVVLFCGDFGTPLRDYSDTIPKSIVSIGPRPIIWHLMKYYAHYRHTEFNLGLGNGGDVLDLRDATESDLWINGGFFAFKHRIFECIKGGDEVVCERFQRLMRDNELVAYQYTGFWACMDTFKDKQRFEDMTSRG